MPMNRSGSGVVFESRALECVAVAVAVLFAADTLRAELGLLWQTLRLLVSL